MQQGLDVPVLAPGGLWYAQSQACLKHLSGVGTDACREPTLRVSQPDSAEGRTATVTTTPKTEFETYPLYIEVHACASIAFLAIEEMFFHMASLLQQLPLASKAEEGITDHLSLSFTLSLAFLLSYGLSFFPAFVCHRATTSGPA